MTRLPILAVLLAFPLAACNPYCRGDQSGSWECFLKGKPSMGGTTSGAPVPQAAPAPPMATICAQIGPVACRNLAY